MVVLPGGVTLLECAIGYALDSVAAVSPQLLSRSTPCSSWDLRMLLHHVNDSLDVLREGIEAGCVRPDPVEDDHDDACACPVSTFHDRAARLLGAWSAAGDRDRLIAVVGQPIRASAVATTGAIEIAVHGWDISRACGRRRPVPSALANEMLTICPLLVTDAIRHPLFADAVAVSPLASPSDRFVAFLGRNPEE
jgi:uncharacterized protein (TIGR03086 family)